MTLRGIIVTQATWATMESSERDERGMMMIEKTNRRGI